MDRPLVSVVIPSRDRAHLLPRSVASALAQTVTDLECVVVDDGSTDGTAEWLADQSDDRVRPVRLRRPSGGAGSARNRGISEACGSFVAFLDSDDEWPPDYLERLLPLFDRVPRPVAVLTGISMEQNGHRSAVIPRIGREPFEDVLAYATPVNISMIIDRDLAGGELIFDETLPATEEHELFLRLCRRFPVVCLSEPLYVAHEPGGPRVSVSPSFAAARRAIIDKYADELARRPHVAAYHFYRLAVVQRRTGDLEGVRASIAEAASLDPGNRRYRWLAAANRLGRPATVGAWRALGTAERLRGREL